MALEKACDLQCSLCLLLDLASVMQLVNAERTLNFHSPMDFIFWLAIINNIFSIFGFTGVLNQQKELVTGFFAYNAVQMIVAFHYFVDVCADVGIR